jgi:glycosyltransferase involved in cell wall biosynthesis
LQSDVLRWLKGSDVRAEVIPNVVNTTRFAPTPLAAASSASPRILFVGYFVPVKNVPLLLDAFARVLAVRPRARLTLVGGGSTAAETAAVHAGIAERALIHAVTVRGWLPRDEVARCMQDNDMLVLPSRSETFGCVVAEALATGRPAVATRCGGPEDIVTEPWMGALCDNGDPQALAEAILAVADRLPQTDPQQLSASAQARFGAPAIAGRLARLYDTLVDGGTRAAR